MEITSVSFQWVRPNIPCDTKHPIQGSTVVPLLAVLRYNALRRAAPCFRGFSQCPLGASLESWTFGVALGRS